MTANTWTIAAARDALRRGEISAVDLTMSCLTAIDAGDGYLMTYGRDPFGNVIEIQQVPEERPYAFAQLRAR